jgi:hypothetical protein
VSLAAETIASIAKNVDLPRLWRLPPHLRWLEVVAQVAGPALEVRDRALQQGRRRGELPRAGPRAIAWPDGCACARCPRGSRARRRCPAPSCSPRSTARGSSATRSGSCASPAAASGSPGPAPAASSGVGPRSSTGPLGDVEALAVTSLAAVVLQEDVAGDPEEVRLEGGAVAHPRLGSPAAPGRSAGSGRARARPPCCGRTAIGVVEALKEHLSGILVAASPGHQELLIIHHGAAC